MGMKSIKLGSAIVIHSFHSRKINASAFLWHFCSLGMLLLLAACAQTDRFYSSLPCPSLESGFLIQDTFPAFKEKFQEIPDEIQKQILGKPPARAHTCYDHFYGIGKFRLNSGTIIMLIGCSVCDSTQSFPDVWAYAFSGQGELEEKAHLNPYTHITESFLFLQTEGVELKAYYQDPLWHRFVRLSWHFSEGDKKFISASDTLTPEQFELKFPNVRIKEWELNDRLLPISKDTLFNSFCDLDKDGVNEHILITDSTGFHETKNILKYFGKLVVYKTLNEGSKEIIWFENDKLILSEDASGQKVTRITCEKGHFSFTIEDPSDPYPEKTYEFNYGDFFEDIVLARIIKKDDRGNIEFLNEAPYHWPLSSGELKDFW